MCYKYVIFDSVCDNLSQVVKSVESVASGQPPEIVEECEKMCSIL